MIERIRLIIIRVVFGIMFICDDKLCSKSQSTYLSNHQSKNNKKIKKVKINKMLRLTKRQQIVKIKGKNNKP